MAIDGSRKELLAIRETEIMQNRLAKAIATGKPMKKMKYAERLKLRLTINQQLLEK